MSAQGSDPFRFSPQCLDYQFSPPDTSFTDMNFQFDPSSLASMSFDADPAQPHLEDNGTIMWGGMEQLSLNKGMRHQKWPPSMGQNLYGQQNTVTARIGQYGQITPPTDGSPLLGSLKQEAAVLNHMFPPVGPGQPQQDPPAASTRSKRGPASRRARDQEERPHPQGVKRHRTTTRKARKGYKAMTQEEEDDSDGEMKRERFLERNRVAASKCRQKKKQWTNGLESHARELAAANAHLSAQALTLRDEVLFLKSECLRHSDCHCSRIREYLDRSIAGMMPGSGFTLDSADVLVTDGSSVTGASRHGSMSVDSQMGDSSVDMVHRFRGEPMSR